MRDLDPHEMLLDEDAVISQPDSDYDDVASKSTDVSEAIKKLLSNIT
jgi:hypothetical protein